MESGSYLQNRLQHRLRRVSLQLGGGARPGGASAPWRSQRDATRLLQQSAGALALVTFTLGLWGCADRSLWAQAFAGEFTYDQYQVVTGSANRQTVLPGFLLGGAMADLAVLSIDHRDQRRLQIYAHVDGTWSPRLDATLGPHVLFVDRIHVDGRDRLITYQPGRLSWFHSESATERALVAATSSFAPPRSGEIPHVDVTRDLNGDGRDDLVVPDVDGFWVWVQLEDGAFTDPVKLGPPTDLSRIYGADGYRYDPWSESRVHHVDYNRDGRADLVFWNGDHFEVHEQDRQGRFVGRAETFTTGVGFDSDKLSYLTTGDMTGRVLHSFTDINADGVADLVVFSLEGTRISAKRSAYEVHFGSPNAHGGTEFAPQVGVAFQSDGSVQLGMDRHDFDGDGQLDLMFTTIEVRFLESSLWKRIKGFMGDDVWLALEFYRMEGGRYPDQPSTIHRRQLDGHPSIREPGSVPLDIALRGGRHQGRKTQKGYLRAFNTTLLTGDVTGDGRSDLLIEWTFEQLHVFVGVPGPELFARPSQKVAVNLPFDEEYTWLVDLNRDGKQDILMHHASTTEEHRVAILIAR